jgi:hypothetical protein
MPGIGATNRAVIGKAIMMFRARKRPIVSHHSSNDEPAWNGWTSTLLDAVNRHKSLEFYMSSMCITWNFNADRLSDAIHLEELDLETRREMPGIATDPPVRFRDDTPYPEIEASLQGKEIQREIACVINPTSSKEVSTRICRRKRISWVCLCERNRFRWNRQQGERVQNSHHFGAN